MSIPPTLTDESQPTRPLVVVVRVSESRSAQLQDGRYQLFWNNAATTEDAPSDEMAFLLANYARQKASALGPLWRTHARYLMDEYEYEYGALHRPYCRDTSIATAPTSSI